MSKKRTPHFFNFLKEDEDSQWIPISDIMTVLMIVFLFISILYIKRIQQQMLLMKQATETIQAINKEYIDYKEVIYKELKKEFDKDLEKWSAVLVKDPITVRFTSPEIMFHAGKSSIQPQFKKILTDFCPRYFTLLNQFQKIIEEVRIEGHTSLEWYGASTKTVAYFNNLELSQERTVSVLKYCVKTILPQSNVKNWAMKSATANGLSSSRLLCSSSNSEVCRAKNRRVEFRVQPNSEDLLNQINKNLSAIEKGQAF